MVILSLTCKYKSWVCYIHRYSSIIREVLLDPVNQFVIPATINLLVKNNMLFYFVISNTVLGKMLISLWTFIKGSQIYRQDIFLRLSNRLPIFEVLEIVAKNHVIPTFVQSTKTRKWTPVLNLDKEAKLIFGDLSTWLGWAPSMQKA